MQLIHKNSNNLRNIQVFHRNSEKFQLIQKIQIIENIQKNSNNFEKKILPGRKLELDFPKAN